MGVDSPGPAGYRVKLDNIRRKERAADMVDAPFTAIERKINELAGMVTTLKKEKEDLASLLARRNAEVKELEGRAAELTKERNEIKSRVDAILARLEGIEL